MSSVLQTALFNSIRHPTALKQKKEKKKKKENCINLPYIYKCLALYLRVFDVANNKFEFINARKDLSNFKESERAREKENVV